MGRRPFLWQPNREGPARMNGAPATRAGLYAGFCPSHGCRRCGPGPPSIWDRRRRRPRAAYPRPRAGYPVPVGAGADAVWPCTPWGLPGRDCRQPRRWALTPPFHPSPVRTVNRPPSAGLFSVARAVARRLTPPDAFLLGSTVPCGVRTFLPGAAGRERPGPRRRPGRRACNVRAGPGDSCPGPLEKGERRRRALGERATPPRPPRGTARRLR